jgi:site-specific DNA recombinase
VGEVCERLQARDEVRTEQPEHEWTTAEAPHLKIINDDLWSRVQARVMENERTAHASPGAPARYLLSGIARCGECGGPITVNNGKSSHTPIKVCLCQYHRTRGDEVCRTSLRRPVDDVDQAVADYLARNVLTEEVVTDALMILRERLTDRMRATSGEVEAMELEAQRLRVELNNLVSAIAASCANVEAVMQAASQRQEKLSALEARIRTAKSAPEAISTELHRLERDARARLADVRTALASNPAEARTLLSKVIAGPLKFTAEGNRYRIEGETAAVTALFSGMPNSASPTGFERDEVAKSSAENAGYVPVRRIMGPAEEVFRRVMGPPFRSMKGPPAKEA